MTHSPAERAVASTTFDVSNVDAATSALREVFCKEAVEALISKPASSGTADDEAKSVEACSSYRGELVANVHFHPVVAAIHLAFQEHRPLILSPDMLWLLVAQGFAHHVNLNAEELRSRLVSHAGKATIAIRRDDFIKGSPENPWPEAFGEFSRCIRGYIGAATHDLLLPNFSTTGAVERAAAEVVLLDAMQSYFKYEFHSMCGIPQITLEGTPEDWTLLTEKTQSLGLFGLEWWTDTLGPVLDEFTAASRGEVNVPFWRAIYKQDHASGGPYTSGWINAFFPYLKDSRTGLAKYKNGWIAKGGIQELLNPQESKSSRHKMHGPTTEAFPGGLARAPFIWNYLGHKFDMEFLGGFVGVRQNFGTFALRPEIGWAVTTDLP